MKTMALTPLGTPTMEERVPVRSDNRGKGGWQVLSGRKKRLISYRRCAAPYLNQ
jgi:hypothetical protein